MGGHDLLSVVGLVLREDLSKETNRHDIQVILAGLFFERHVPIEMGLQFFADGHQVHAFTLPCRLDAADLDLFLEPGPLSIEVHAALPADPNRRLQCGW